MPVRILSQAQARAADRAAAAAGMPIDLLMEQAGVAVATAAQRSFATALAHGVLVLAGAGANGGDGLVAARVLADRGRRVIALVAGGAAAFAGRGPDQREALRRLAPYGVPVDTLTEEAVRQALAQLGPALVVDAITGTGVEGGLRPEAAGALAAARAGAGAILAVDLPSGVDPDSGLAGEGSVAADRTVAMGFRKPGHVLWPGAGLCGGVDVAPIGLAPFGEALPGPRFALVDRSEAATLLVPRPATAHKGTAGRLVVVAGSPGFEGAAVLCALGGLHGGAGRLTVRSTDGVRAALRTRVPEAMAIGPEQDLAATLGEAQAVAIGPGLGRSAGSADLVRLVLARARAAVLDADALTSLADVGEGWARDVAGAAAAGAGRLVLTPHPGEAATLLAALGEGAPTATEVDAARLEAARSLARAAGAVVLLKGRPTVVARPDGDLRVNPTGTAAMGTGGTGDVLTGLVGALLAQGMAAWDAAALAAFVHGLAGERAAGGSDRGLAASALAAALPGAFAEVLGGGRA